MKWIYVLLFIFCFTLVQSITINQFVVSSGYQNSTDGTVVHQSSLGQTSTETMSNTAYTLHSGFWQPITRPLESGIEGNASLITYNSPGGLITNVSITVNGTIVHPDGTGHFSITLAPGTYTLSASLAGYNPVEITGIVVNSSQYTQRNVTLADWAPITGTQYSMLMLSSVMRGTTTISGTNGNLLAAFGTGGNQDCRGIGMWIPELGIYYMDIVGNTGGQIISFKFFDQTNGQVLNCSETITFADNTMIGDFGSPFLLHLPLGSISNVVIQKSGNDIILNWDGPDGVNYHVYRSNNANSGFSSIGTVQVRSFTDINITSNPCVFYRITYEQ